MVKVFLLALLCAVYVQSAVIRTFIVRDVQPGELSHQTSFFHNDQSLQGHRKRVALLKKSDDNVWNKGFYKRQRERRNTPPWLKSRYGRGIMNINAMKMDKEAEKVPRENYEKKVRDFLLQNGIEEGVDSIKSTRFARQLWHRQRYGRKRDPESPRSPLGDSRRRISKEEAKRLSSTFFKHRRSAPGWHHGRYGKREFEYESNGMKRETPHWAKGRYGKRENDQENHELSRRYRREDDNQEQDEDEIYEDSETVDSEDGHDDNQRYYHFSRQDDH